MKKIVYIGNNLTDKNPTTLVALSKILAEEGYSVHVYSNLKNKFLRFLNSCLGVLKHYNADYILIDTYSTKNFYMALAASQLARLLAIKYIPILHGGNLKRRLNRNPLLCTLIFKYAEINVAPSTYFLKVFQSKNFNIVCIPNAIDIKKYSFKKRVNLNPTLLWVRAFDKIYNPTMAVDVLALLQKKYPTAKLCMIGPDKDGSLNKAKLLAKKRTIEDDIEFTGRLTKKQWNEKSRKFDVFINTTTIDNLPVSVIEAMALGLPVFSTNVGGIPFLIRNEENGFLVDSNNTNQMVNAIDKLIKNPTKTSEIVKNARATVCNFDSEIVKDKWNAILN